MATYTLTQMNIETLFGGYPYLFIIASHDYKIMTPLTSLEKCPMDSYQGRVLFVQI